MVWPLAPTRRNRCEGSGVRDAFQDKISSYERACQSLDTRQTPPLRQIDGDAAALDGTELASAPAVDLVVVDPTARDPSDVLPPELFLFIASFLAADAVSGPPPRKD